MIEMNSMMFKRAATLGYYWPPAVHIVRLLAPKLHWVVFAWMVWLSGTLTFANEHLNMKITWLYLFKSYCYSATAKIKPYGSSISINILVHTSDVSINWLFVGRQYVIRCQLGTGWSSIPISSSLISLKARFMGTPWAHLGPRGPLLSGMYITAKITSCVSCSHKPQYDIYEKIYSFAQQLALWSHDSNTTSRWQRMPTRNFE